MQANVFRLLELQQLLASFSQVDRRLHRLHDEKYIQENDTEHSYNLAMTAWYLSKWFPELNKDFLIRYSLAHDLVEIHAGDTYTYGTESELSSKKTREAKALKKLEADWEDFGDMTAAIHAYENRRDAESQFVYALDKIMPMMMVYIHNGYSWKKEGVTVDMLHRSNIEKISLSLEILPYYEALRTLLLSRPDLIKVT